MDYLLLLLEPLQQSKPIDSWMATWQSRRNFSPAVLFWQKTATSDTGDKNGEWPPFSNMVNECKWPPTSTPPSTKRNWKRSTNSPVVRRELMSHGLYMNIIQYTYGSVSKPCTPVVHIKIAGKWMFIPLKMVLIGIDRSPYSIIFPIFPWLARCLELRISHADVRWLPLLWARHLSDGGAPGPRCPSGSDRGEVHLRAAGLGRGWLWWPQRKNPWKMKKKT